ncbi:maltose alpha-D-glucosyltransferase [Luteibacter yeojuensis]|uniref:Trehalose synthase n=1 Tax=Luteibacter yeojuensis TaxID=345309 RepID=A0A0F3KRC7_9GAMM|nr:maltose alpha-D-glucosyltransferase [Luteibacter yeojuensis]KJV33815.1 trehalose synthase [Luteibacter yeojuensis]
MTDKKPTLPPSAIEQLAAESMLAQARAMAVAFSGTGRMWQHPYAIPRPRSASAIAPVWFTAYPASIITGEGESVLKTLSDPSLWSALSSIGIRGVHTGPMKRAGGWTPEGYTPTVDGHFDRIGFEIDPDFGSTDEYVALSRMAAAHNVVVIDDVVPAHTGKGADFRLAEMGHGDYPGLYHMVEIPEEDWPHLPEVADGDDAANLSPAQVDYLHDRGYIVGQLQRVIFFEPGVKETDWSATPVVVGTDGKARRWVYLHYFKDGQPSLNWLDPSFAAQQLVVGDALHSIDRLGARGLRLDANGFLGVERRTGGPAWSEGHPLSLTGNALLAGMIRKAGGFSFQELNLTLDDIAAMSRAGADLSYDFITRPAYQHALLTGDAEYLRMMLRMAHEYGIDPGSLIHALQNHDELTTELVHFWTLHANDMYTFGNQSWQGRTLRTHLRETIHERLAGTHAPYNHRFVTNGIACTTVSVITAALDITDLDAITDEQLALIRKIHLLLVMYNAFQPGVFALSGWDLVGALPLPLEAVAERAAEGDVRWIERGGYDLAGRHPEADASAGGLPRARSLYGALPAQLKDPDSFASQLKHLLSVREAYQIGASHQIAIPDVAHPGLLVMVHELPDGRGTQVTALNFSGTALEEQLTLQGVQPGPVVDMVAETITGDLAEDGLLTLALGPYEGVSLRVVGALPSMA